MFSIIMPMDMDRLEQFAETKKKYDSMFQKKQFIIPTRSSKLQAYLRDKGLMKDTQVIMYAVERGFNCSKALNIGVRNAKYEYIVVTSPEVKPTTDVLSQFEQSLGRNLICNVADQDIKGNLTPLVMEGYRDSDPAMYFLALFNKSDIEKINGWDEDFMDGYAYEDNDFGARWNRAKIPFQMREDIQATHQYHPRAETIQNGTSTNYIKFSENTKNNVVYCKKGIKQ